MQFQFNWDCLSVIAGMHFTGTRVRSYDGSIKKEQSVELLKASKVHFHRPLLISWDGARPHRSRLLREHIESTEGRIAIDGPPLYAREFNPFEYLWVWLKRYALANFRPDTLAGLKHTARGRLVSTRRRFTIIASCWVQAALF